MSRDQQAPSQEKCAHDKAPQRMAMRVQDLEAIIAHSAERLLTETEQATRKAAVTTLAHLTAERESKEATVARLRRLLFGASTESTARVLGEAAKGEATDAAGSSAATGSGESAGHAAASDDDANAAEQRTADGASPEAAAAKPKKKRPGHGRNGVDDYPRAPHVAVPHATLRHGDPCPEDGCTGRVYAQRAEPAVLIRITGAPPLGAVVYELERLRCGLCGTVFTAAPPPEIGEKKHDHSAAAMIALLNICATAAAVCRSTALSACKRVSLRRCLPARDVVAAAAASLRPAYEELVRQAAEATVVYNDDTTMRVLNLSKEARAEELPPGASAERTGVFTSSIVAETPHGRIALFKTGPCHAGEHLAELLDQRESAEPPIQMSDGLSRNKPGDHQTLRASCIPHGRRNYVVIADSFPVEVAFVLESLTEVFHTDAQARERGLSPAARPSLTAASTRKWPADEGAAGLDDQAV